jgi:hypothetical protein
MSTVCHPATGTLRPAFAALAKHYGVAVDICPSRRGNRKGVVEKANHSAAQRWWRTVADDASTGQAQTSLDRLAGKVDGRVRHRDGAATTVGALADAEALRPAPVVAFPAELAEPRTVSPAGVVSWRGNQYSVPPGLAGAVVAVTHRLGSETVRVATASGVVIAAHLRAPDGGGRMISDAGHVAALERAVLASFTTAKPCTHKTRRPASPAALAEAARLRGQPSVDPAHKVVIDLAAYVAAAERLSGAPQQDRTDKNS